MAGFDDITKKAQRFLGDPKVKDALRSEKAERVSDSILDAVAGAADRATGGKHRDTIDKARDAADSKIGEVRSRGDQGGHGAHGDQGGEHGGAGHDAR